MEEAIIALVAAGERWEGVQSLGYDQVPACVQQSLLQIALNLSISMHDPWTY